MIFLGELSVDDAPDNDDFPGPLDPIWEDEQRFEK